MNRTFQAGDSGLPFQFNQTAKTFANGKTLDDDQTKITLQNRKEEEKAAGENQRVIPDTPNGCKGVQIDSSMDMHDDMVLLTQTLENNRQKET